MNIDILNSGDYTDWIVKRLHRFIKFTLGIKISICNDDLYKTKKNKHLGAALMLS